MDCRWLALGLHVQSRVVDLRFECHAPQVEIGAPCSRPSAPLPPPRTVWSHRPPRELTTPAPQAHRLAWAQREAARGRGGTTIGRSADGLSCRAGGPGQLLPKVGLRRTRRQAERCQLRWTRWRAGSEPPRSTASCLQIQMPSRR
eukprot:scaffold2469_cov57-Phaeocystis_antarctica.AAC.1